jgi:hypothetical protein
VGTGVEFSGFAVGGEEAAAITIFGVVSGARASIPALSKPGPFLEAGSAVTPTPAKLITRTTADIPAEIKGLLGRRLRMTFIRAITRKNEINTRLSKNIAVKK